MITWMYGILYVLCFMTGASIYSFLNVVVYRVPRKISFVHGFSACPDCGTRLKALDLVPIFSYLCLGRKCRYCKEKISSRYMWVELLGGVTACFLAYFYGWNVEAVTVFALFFMLTVITLVDYDTMEIPNGFVIAVGVIALISYVTMPGISLMYRILGMFVVSVPLLLITLVIPGAFGGGDIKLMFAAGFLLGIRLSLLSLFLGIILGGGYGMYLLAGKKIGRKEHFAFGPFLCVGMAIAVLWGNPIIDWYLSICGM